MTFFPLLLNLFHLNWINGSAVCTFVFLGKRKQFTACFRYSQQNFISDK